MSNPYSGRPSYTFWRPAVSRVEPFAIEPAVVPKFQIAKSDKVATAGSCFAQHISHHIAKIGFNYFVPEKNPRLTSAQARAQRYGFFSARYGNIYTIHQLRQLFDEAVNGTARHEQVWERDGRYFDPYRPSIFPNGFDSPEEVMEERRRHLAKVREVFEQCAVFVFTLGLTEAWRSRIDQAVFPLAPSVVASSFDPELHEFHNFTVDEVRSELFAFIDELKEFNPGVKVLLTVSPVPLIATYEDRHVLVSTTYSKSVLRVAAGEAADRYDHVDYFPSYEIITGSPTGGLYYEDDQREVNSIGIAHAMRSFVGAYTARPKRRSVRVTDSDLKRDQSIAKVLCDEEEIERSLKRR